MGEKDYNCSYNNEPEVYHKILAQLTIKPNELYHNIDYICLFAKAIKDYTEAPAVMLPFCCTLEAESFGAVINMEHGMPRVKNFVYDNLDDILLSKGINLDEGRLLNIKQAIGRLSVDETVCMEISGPISILSQLMDLKKVLKTWRKNPQQMNGAFLHLRRALLKYMYELKEAGVDLFCYADSVGSYQILGPHFAKELAENFLKPFLREVKECNFGLVHICPKSSNLLVSLDYADWRSHDIDKDIGSYLDGCLSLRHKVCLGGITCIQNRNYKLNGCFHELVLSE